MSLICASVAGMMELGTLAFRLVVLDQLGRAWGQKRSMCIGGERTGTEATTLRLSVPEEWFSLCYRVPTPAVLHGSPARPPTEEELAGAVAWALEYRFNRGYTGQTRITAV